MTIQLASWVRRQMACVPFIYPMSVKLTKRFKVERELIKGNHHNTNSHRSIIHFSVNKAATQYTKSLLSRCAQENGLTHIRIHDYAFFSDFPYLDHLSAQQMLRYKHIFKPRGYLYSVFGGMIEGIENLDEYDVVLMIRDPRDVLTSGYFSIAYSHIQPGGRNKVASFMRERAFAQKAGIDEYVINKSEHVRRVFQRYLDLLIHGRPGVYVTKYEEMVSDFPAWLSGLLDHCELETGPNRKRELLAEAVGAPKKEDISQNRRQVTPGDHTRKLRPETVDQLNALFSDILTGFGYKQTV